MLFKPGFLFYSAILTKCINIQFFLFNYNNIFITYPVQMKSYLFKSMCDIHFKLFFSSRYNCTIVAIVL